MKTVFSNAMVAHIFVNQSQASGRTSNGNFSFQGTRLYSYSTVIAEWRVAVDGTRVLNRTNQTFSHTTSGKHEPALRHAMSDEIRSFRVPFLSRYDSEHDNAANDLGNLDHLLSVARAELAYGKTCRLSGESWNAKPVSHEDAGEYGNEPGSNAADLVAAAHWMDAPIPRFISSAIQQFGRARLYAATFGLTIQADLPAEIAAALSNWNARVAAYNTPQAIKRRATDLARRERKESEKIEATRVAMEAAQLRQFEFWVERGRIGNRPRSSAFKPDSPQFAELKAIEDVEEAQESREIAEAFHLWQMGEAPRPNKHRYKEYSIERIAIDAAEAAEEAAEEAIKLAEWRKGSDAPFYGSDESGHGAALRLKGNDVQTSRGATVPLQHALKAFAFMRLVWSRGETWKRNGHSLRVGLFAIDSIDADKVKAGCHIILRNEIERFAAEIDAQVEPSDSALS